MLRHQASFCAARHEFSPSRLHSAAQARRVIEQDRKSGFSAGGNIVNRFWLQQYPDGVPADVDVHQYSSLIELFEESFTTFADRKAAICMDKAITYGELDEMSAAIGAYLQSRGLAKGARVAVMMPRSAKSCRVSCRFACRLYDSERQSSLHSAGAGASAQGFRR
jgi:non-ribosomal peptide synthetase component F